jgi:hypothetical protein
MGDSGKIEEKKYAFHVKEGKLDELPPPPWVDAAQQVYRFKAEGAGISCAIAIGGGLKVTDLKWEQGDLSHGAETTLRARIENWDGGKLRFVVQHQHEGEWHHYASVPATVKGSEASAVLRVHHPVLPSTGPEPAPADVKNAQPAELRFYLEEGEAHSQAHAHPHAVTPASTSKKPEAQAGTLSVVGALVGQGFFILDAENHPVRAGGSSGVKTDAAVVQGHYFIPGRREAKFENLPAGHYKIVFPPEPHAGDKPTPPTVKPNEHGAHVVHLDDFTHHGAVCEVEVKQGESPKVQITVSADGSVRVCC